jgi:hypothetical protein
VAADRHHGAPRRVEIPPGGHAETGGGAGSEHRLMVHEAGDNTHTARQRKKDGTLRIIYYARAWKSTHKLIAAIETHGTDTRASAAAEATAAAVTQAGGRAEQNGRDVQDGQCTLDLQQLQSYERSTAAAMMMDNQRRQRIYLVAESRARRALLGAAERAHTGRRDAPHCTDAAPGRRMRRTGASAPDDDVRYVMHRHERLEAHIQTHTLTHTPPPALPKGGRRIPVRSPCN